MGLNPSVMTPQLLKLAWTGHTDRGKIRKNNEDSFLCLEFDGKEVRYLGKLGSASLLASDYVFAVSDGMGGANAGEFASRIAVEKITKLLPAAFLRGAEGLGVGVAETLEELFDEIHQALLYLGSCYEECSGMGATLTLCWLRPGWLHFAHIGDSRLYYLPGSGGPLRQLTHDHTHVGWLFRNGKINEREARSHSAKNSLQRALGAGHQFVEPQTGSVGLEPGDRFLICSDGLVDGFFDARLGELLADPFPPTAPDLVRQAVENSGRDNTTAIVITVVP
ncbi:MAG: protein-serine/threonine phosphatase PrpC [Terrimicrobiaceae bacterium]